MQPDLFDDARPTIDLGPGAAILGGFARDEAQSLIAAIGRLARTSPFRQMETPGGRRMSVASFSCGELGWISDRSGYRYGAIDPLTDRPWPAMPPAFHALAARAAAALGFADFTPHACLINRYAPGARLSLHQDRDECDRVAPIVSVSLGLPATFLWGGMRRSDRPTRRRLIHGDVVVWGGASRLAFHGVAAVKPGWSGAAGALRYNLTFRKVR